MTYLPPPVGVDPTARAYFYSETWATHWSTSNWPSATIQANYPEDFYHIPLMPESVIGFYWSWSHDNQEWEMIPYPEDE
jgi:hypothetical protein